jgi:GT2 family glycosyltransferase
MAMHISVCIPSVRPTTLAQAVASIVAQTKADWDLVVVGQGVEEASLRSATLRATRGDPRVTYIHSEKRGACAARNAGFRSTSGEIVAFMDDDCQAAPDWLEQLCLSFDDPAIAMVGGAVLRPPAEGRAISICPTIDPEDVLWDPRTAAEPPPGFGLLGANMAVRRSAGDAIGLFDECLGPGSRFPGGEEHDYSYRLVLHGLAVRSTPKPVVEHTYGVRYGLREVYAHRRDRLRGDGGLSGKATLVAANGERPSTAVCVTKAALAQLRTVSVLRLPNALLRLSHYLKSYAECLDHYRVADADDPARAVLVHET